MAKSYLKDQKRVLPSAAWCDGEYGLDGMYVGVPTLIGGNGAEKIIEFDFNDTESDMFMTSVTAVKGLVEDCKKLEPALA